MKRLLLLLLVLFLMAGCKKEKSTLLTGVLKNSYTGCGSPKGSVRLVSYVRNGHEYMLATTGIPAGWADGTTIVFRTRTFTDKEVICLANVIPVDQVYDMYDLYDLRLVQD